MEVAMVIRHPVFNLSVFHPVNLGHCGDAKRAESRKRLE